MRAKQRESSHGASKRLETKPELMLGRGIVEYTQFAAEGSCDM
jgi:hypothetical protein